VVVSLRKWNRWSIVSCLLAIQLRVIGQSTKWIAFSLLRHDLLHEFLLLLLFGSRQPHSLPVLFVKHLLQMTLSFEVELFYLLAVVYSLRINLRITKNNTLPDRFVSLLECHIEVLLVLNGPKRLLSLDFLTELTLQQWFALALDLYFDVLGLYVDNHLLGCGSLGQLNLNIDVFNTLRPVVFFSRRSVVCANSFINLELRFFIVWFLVCFLNDGFVTDLLAD